MTPVNYIHEDDWAATHEASASLLSTSLARGYCRHHRRLYTFLLPRHAEGKFKSAVEAYTAAIDALPTAVLYCELCCDRPRRSSEHCERGFLCTPRPDSRRGTPLTWAPFSGRCYHLVFSYLAASPFPGNRAFAQLKCENFGSAIADAGAALALDPSSVKAYYRRGSAHLALSKYKAARPDFRTVVKLRPTDKDARAKLDECDKAIRKQLFEDVSAGSSRVVVAEYQCFFNAYCLVVGPYGRVCRSLFYDEVNAMPFPIHSSSRPSRSR